MDLFEAIARRYSHKAPFRTDPVPKEDLRRIVEAGMAAPSGLNGQSPEFIIVNEPATLRRIGEITGIDTLRTAPAMIVLVSNPREPAPGYSALVEDYAAATENLLLAATALGYACGWEDAIVQREPVRQALYELLAIPPDHPLQVIVPVGLPAVPGPRRSKKPFPQRASWNRYAIVE